MALMAMEPKIDVTEPEKGKVKVVVDAAVATSLIKILNFDRMDISAAAVAVSPSEAEVALALDTTGSMKNDMGTLQAMQRNSCRPSSMPRRGRTHCGSRSCPMWLRSIQAGSFCSMRMQST